MTITREDVALCGAILMGLALFAMLLKPSSKELEDFERVEASVEPVNFLELGLVLVVLAAVCVASVAFRYVVGGQ